MTDRILRVLGGGGDLPTIFALLLGSLPPPGPERRAGRGSRLKSRVFRCARDVGG